MCVRDDKQPCYFFSVDAEHWSGANEPNLFGLVLTEILNKKNDTGRTDLSVRSLESRKLLQRKCFPDKMGCELAV